MARPCICDRCVRGGPFTRDQCRRCWLFHNDAIYHAHWSRENPSPRAAAGPAPLDCVHRGSELRAQICQTCRGSVQLKIFACAKHGECHLGGAELPSVVACRRCRDYQKPDDGREKLLLRTDQPLAPGDIVTLTTAVYELHRRFPGRYITDVDCIARELFDHNPHITRLERGDPSVRVITIGLHLINECHRPVHMIECFWHDLCRQLGVGYEHPAEFRGHIYLTDAERSWPAELLPDLRPFWLINAGWKNDVTVKAWPTEHYQSVVDHFLGRIEFVQIGEHNPPHHNHPPLKGVINLVGRTGPPDSRKLARLVYHSSGVLCGLTFLMHLAAAVPTPHGNLRPAVILNGGREPPHYSQYPGHTVLHSIGALPCCARGACWKARTVPLGDGHDGAMCENPAGGFPLCMRHITPAEAIAAIERYRYI